MATTRCLLLSAVLFTVFCIQVHCRAVQQADNSTLYVHGNLRTVNKDLLTDDDLDEYQPNEAYDDFEVGRRRRQTPRPTSPPPPPPLFEFHWWNHFIRTLIDKCRMQRTHDQFSVLYMGTIPMDDTPYHIHFEPHEDNSDNPVLNPDRAYAPRRSEFNNYIVARPREVSNQRGMEHAEDIMLRQLNDLWNAYREHHGHHPNMIVVYSWFMPCSRCTDLIIARFGNHEFNHVPYKVVAYTSEGTNLPYMDHAGNEAYRQRLRNRNFLIWNARHQRPGLDTSDPAVDMINNLNLNMTGPMFKVMANNLGEQETPDYT